MLWLFAQYYHAIGFRVVIYDRYGRHWSYLRDLIALGRVHYHPYTAFELARPEVYTTERARQEVRAASDLCLRVKERRGGEMGGVSSGLCCLVLSCVCYVTIVLNGVMLCCIMSLNVCAVLCSAV